VSFWFDHTQPSPIVAYDFDRTSFHGFLAKRLLLLRGGRLLKHIGVAAEAASALNDLISQKEPEVSPANDLISEREPEVSPAIKMRGFSKLVTWLLFRANYFEKGF